MGSATMPKIPSLKNRYSGIVAAMAECNDCDWKTDSYKNALANASLHTLAGQATQ